MKTIRGSSTEGRGLKIGVVVSCFYSEISDSLLAGALQALREAGVGRRSTTVVSVPGAFELPVAAKRLAKMKKPDAIVCVGAVIRGQTEHFTYVCKAAQEGILQVSLEMALPVTFGVLTTENREQALARARPGPENKGYQAARDAVEMVNTLRLIG